MSTLPLDCVVIGAGPAGLTAAIYLARFRRRFLVADGGSSRAALIPLSRNFAGFPDGIRGTDLLDRMNEQAVRYGATIQQGEVTALESCKEGFRVTLRGRTLTATTVLLATGVSDIEPGFPGLADSVRRGLIRHCGICDAFEAIDHNIGIIGRGRTGVGEALFLRGYSPRVTLLSLGEPCGLGPVDRRRLSEAGVGIVEQPISDVMLNGSLIVALTAGDGRKLEFDTLYSALGSIVRSELAVRLGAAIDERNCLVVDAHQHSSVEGLFVAGDVASGLDQIGVAIGQAAVAATTIHNRLRGET